ncbi:MAG TPA: preprotein translocase subunit SecY [Terriglobia bacterium]|jgi:preprotein translocase subunit SecY|nr:preprotein translocase subunit SecY [Terriglobia bacterium]
MIESLKSITEIPDLRKRIFYTLLLLAVYRLGSFIPTPGINADVFEQAFNQLAGSLFGLLSMFSGGSLRRLTVFALGIMPYITASIILQLLGVVSPTLEKLRKEGELGRRKITEYTRWLTVGLSAFQAFAIAGALQRQTSLGTPLVTNPGPGFIITTVITLTTGSVFIMWLGEQITARGIGNGMSLLIFAGIVVGLPRAIADLWDKVFISRVWGPLSLLVLLVFMLAIVAFIVLVERGERRIPIQYAKRVVGRRIMGGVSTHLPLKVNSGGVMPIIFAVSILTFPQTVGLFFSNKSGYLARGIDWFVKVFAYGEPLYTLCYVLMILFFAHFYLSIVYNPDEVADNVRKQGGFIPGIRPGKRTADYLDDVLTKITWVGGLYLALIALIPEIMLAGLRVNHLPAWMGGAWFDAHLPGWLLHGLNVNFYFGGTSLLIVVGVAMDTVQQVEAQLIMRHYEGFLKKGRVRGRRSA